MENSKFVIIGGGLAGSLMAIGLAKLGHEISIYEKRPDLREKEIEGGRSINLALSHRGLLALEKVGMKEKIEKYLIPMKGRIIHTGKDEIQFQPYGKDDSEVINSVSRSDLNKILIEEADSFENVNFYFNHECHGYDNRTNELNLTNENNEEIKLKPNCIIAADGANSSIRTSMLKMGRFNYSQTFMNYGYKELEIPASDEGDFRIENYGLHIWPRENFVMIALPNPDKTFTLTLFAPFEGINSFDKLNSESQILHFFNENFPDVVNKIPNLIEDFQRNPTGNLVTVKCEPWNKGRAVLIGDAAHAIIPFYGQGMNAAFEDVRLLTQFVEEMDNWQEIIEKFSSVRKRNGDAIAQLSYDNFIEMRDGVADEEYLVRKEIELKLYDKYEDVISKYAMVTFHPELEYYEAKKKGDILEEVILDYQTKLGQITEQNLEEIHQTLTKRFKKIE